MAINLNDNSGQNQSNAQGSAGNNPNDQANLNTPKASGTGFTNLKSVLNANQNNNLANVVQGGVQNVTNQTQNQTQQQQQQFNNSLGNAVQDIKAGNTVNQNLQGVDFANNQQQAISQIQNLSGVDPNSATGQTYAQEASALQNGYQGQQGLTNAAQLQSQAQNLQQIGQGLGSSAGRQAALAQFVNAGPDYTTNKQQLDNLLLGQNTQAINDARRNALITANQTNQAVNNAANIGQNTSQQFNALNPVIQNNLNTVAGNLNNALNSAVTTDTQQANTDQTNLVNAINNKTANAAQIQYLQNALGSGNLYNFNQSDLAALTNANTGQYNASSVANQGEFNAAQTLAALAGGAGKLASLPTLNANQVGTAQTGSLAGELSVNQPTLQAYQNQAQTAQNNINNFTYSPSAGYGYNLTNSGPSINYQQAGQILNPSISSDLTQLQNGTNTANTFNDLLSQLYSETNAGTLNPAAIWAGVVPGGNISNAALSQLENLNSQYGAINQTNNPQNTLQSEIGGPRPTAVSQGPAISPRTAALKRLASQT